MEEKDIEIGLELDDLKKSRAGRYLFDSVKDMKRANNDMMATGRMQKGEGKGLFVCVTIGEFERARGISLGIQSVIDFINGEINKAKRAKEDKNKENE